MNQKVSKKLRKYAKIELVKFKHLKINYNKLNKNERTKWLKVVDKIILENKNG